ncbi:hypothetical protein [uncultured Holdemanella sp.]|uniref:hypothetical protein n=1 Tax=uncultured Holdemanella sp. TaxID=1763549 RepID=UPI002600F78C|nr:hypothetical protein [uncultured Holdemanella sp.]
MNFEVEISYKAILDIRHIYAIYTVFIYSLFARLITDVLPIDVSIASSLAGTDLLFCALFGGMIV